MSGPATRKLSVSLPVELAESVRRAAGDQAGGNVSAWLAALAEEELRRQASLAAVREWEREHGEITAEEREEVRRRWLA